MVAAYIPVSKVRGSRRDGRPMCIEHPGGYGCGWWQAVASRSQRKGPAVRGYVRTYVKLWTLNSAIDPELRDRKVEDRANSTSSA